VWYCLSFAKPEMHINHVMRYLCSAKKQRSFEKIEKIVRSKERCFFAPYLNCC
jgi:hypothetical protein